MTTAEKDGMNVPMGTGLARMKQSYVRNKNLLKAARILPCQHCGIDNGTVVAAHTNWGGGKGRGIKANDNLIAALCLRCHYEIDQGKTLSKQERQEMWQTAHRKTVNRLVELDLWPSNVAIPTAVA